MDSLDPGGRFLEVVLASISDVVFVLDAEARITYAGPSAERLVGYPPADLVGRNAYDFVHPDDRGAFRDRARRTLRAPHRPVRLELRLLRRDGEWAWTEGIAQNLLANPSIAGVLIVVRDVSERRRTEEVMRSSATRAAAILSTTPDAIVTIDEHGAIETFNPAATRIFGFDAAEVIGRPVNILMPEPHRSRHDEYIARYLATGDGGAVGRCRELTARRKDGSLLPIELTIGEAVLGERRVFTGVIRDISERKLAEEALRLKQGAVEAAADPILITDARGTIVYVNPAFTALTGYTAGEAVGQTPRLLKSGIQSEAVYRELWRTIGAGGVWRGEIVNRRKDGTLYTEQQTITPLRDAAGEITHFVAVKLDITERKRADEALLRYAARLEAVHAIDLAVLAARSPKEVATVVLSHLFPLVPAQRASVVVFDDAAGTAEFLATEGGIGPPAGTRMPRSRWTAPEVERSRGVHRFDDLAAIPDTSPLFQTLSALGLRSALTAPLVVDDALIGELNLSSTEPAAFSTEHLEILREVADQLSVALHQAQLRARVAHDQARLALLVQQLPEGVALLDADHRVVLTNELGRRHLAALDAQPAEGPLERLGGVVLASLLASSAELLPLEITVGAGKPRVFRVRCREVRANDRTTGWILLLRDVTEEKLASERLEQHNRLAVIGQMAGGLAHDFNNILTSIITYPELLLRGGNLDPQTAAAMLTVVGQAQRGAALVRQMLDFSRRSVSERRPLQLGAFLTDLAKILTRTLPARIKVTLDLPAEGSFAIVADATQLEQILINLALNARDAMPDNGELRLTCRRLNGWPADTVPPPEDGAVEWVHLTVSDTGHGISQEALPHIFEPFFTTKPIGVGTGLGLAQVYGLVQQHGGAITVDSAPGRGATFNLYFPALAAGAPAAEPAAAGQLPTGNGELILLAEDENEVRDALREALTLLGYDVHAVANGREALDHLRKESRTDLLVTDLQMPEMDGAELAEQVRRAWPALPIVALTGFSAENSVEKLRRAGVHDTAQKPVSLERLASVVRRALDGRGS